MPEIDKIELLMEEMDCLDIDILRFLETHLKEDISDCEYDRYTFIHSPSITNIQREGAEVIIKNKSADKIATFKKVKRSTMMLTLKNMGLNIVIILAYAPDTGYT